MFSPDYVTARRHFLQFAARAGARLESLPLRAKGSAGEDLSIDIAWLGSDNPQHVFLHSSGLHGVEGFAGSAIQLQLLEQPPELRNNSALVLVHILNPYGMSWFRRVNENNVDLNRNFLPEGEHRGAPPAYAMLDRFLNPASPPSRDFFAIRAIYLVLRNGMGALKQAVAGGQYEYPKGLFFGGRQLEDGLRQYHSFVQRRLAAAESVVAVDVHTGLGKYGKDTLLVNARDAQRLRPIFGERVCAMDPERSPAYHIRGGLPELLADALPNARLHFLGQEFGTYNPIKVVRILRAENRWHHYGAATTVAHPVKRALKQVFCPDDASWRRDVLKRGRELVDQALGYGMLAAIEGEHATSI